MEEERRLDEPAANGWKVWGPYLSERQWGTVREDYSPGGTAWDSFSHDVARSRAYRWGEDGLFGISDDQQILCLALALWNGRDPILKERLFGLTNSEGNHGEDVKECYYYLDATPTHSYLKGLYKYPHQQFPYARLVEENRRRSKDDPEFELIDTGVFDGNRYFDVVTEYAKHSPSDILVRITVHNRGPEAADLHVLPQLWFRNTWSWGYPARKPELTLDGDVAVARSELVGTHRLYREGDAPWLFTDNETNGVRLFGLRDSNGHFKDAFHAFVVDRNAQALNPQHRGTKDREWYMHPNGQLPAYEWAFGDVNPPVHGWATWRVFQMDRKRRRLNKKDDPGDLVFLERVFHKLMLNFTWWVNRKDAEGRNVFQGGFLGLDNIGVFDRSAPLPTGGYINQSDGTSWMAMYCLNLMRIALELAQHNHVYEDIATKFFEHFLHIAEAMTNAADGMGLWNDEDGFFYDVLNLPDGRMLPLKVRSMVGLIPLFAVETLEPELCAKVPAFTERLDWFLNYRPDLAGLVSRWNEPGKGERRLLSLLRGSRMKKLLRRMLDESEFLSDYGVRALSRYHREHPYTLEWNHQRFSVEYQPGESTSGLFGGNSNWRGPIWMPVNYLIIESLQKFHHYYGDDFKVECPTGSGRYRTIDQVSAELATRLTGIFLRNGDGERPVFGDNRRLQDDPHFRDHVWFHEYFHGDTGRGVGASHQTGWTGLVAKLLQPRHQAAEAPDVQHGTATERRADAVAAL